MDPVPTSSTAELELVIDKPTKPSKVITDVLAQQVVVLYETYDTPAEEIADLLELDVTLVKVTLNSHSSLYRKRLGVKQEDISDQEYDEFLRIYKNMAIATEDEHIKERMLWKLMQEKKGRNDPNVGKNVIQDRTMNITQFNTIINQAREKSSK